MGPKSFHHSKFGFHAIEIFSTSVGWNSNIRCYLREVPLKLTRQSSRNFFWRRSFVFAKISWMYLSIKRMHNELDNVRYDDDGNLVPDNSGIIHEENYFQLEEEAEVMNTSQSS